MEESAKKKEKVASINTAKCNHGVACQVHASVCSMTLSVEVLESTLEVYNGSKELQ